MDENSLAENEQFYIEKRMGHVWVTLPECVTMHNYSAIEYEICRQLTDGADCVVFDLSTMREIYSSGLGILIRIRKKVGEKGGAVCLVNIAENILEMLKSLHLDKIFPIYATDVEFEISQDSVWHQRLTENKIEFLFIAQVENGVYRISISGEMIADHDMSSCLAFEPDPQVKRFIIDMSTLSSMDSNGAGVFMNLVDRLAQQGERCRAFGASQAIRQVLQFLGVEQYLDFYDGEKEALSGIL